MKYCGREFEEQEIKWIRDRLRQAKPINRAQLSRAFCEWANWRKPDGGLKEMSCRVVMLRMARDGLIKLPPAQKTNGNGRVPRRRAMQPEFMQALNGSAGDYDLEINVVASKAAARLWNDYMASYHYLGYVRLGGAQIRYLVRIAGQPVALFGFGAAAWKVGERDKHIGWTKEQRESRLHLIVNNQRFLILPWIRIRYLASKVLSLVARRICNDWQSRYGYKPVLLETFVQKDRFRGSSYAAANWKNVGDTQGRGKYDRDKQYKEPIKAVWLKPLVKNYRKRLTQGKEYP